MEIEKKIRKQKENKKKQKLPAMVKINNHLAAYANLLQSYIN
jgi:hypothetical protein